MFPATDPAAIANIWARTRAMLARAGDEIGAASALAARLVLSPSRRRQIASWIALLETIVRKLLLAEAAKLLGAEARSREPSIEHVLLYRKVRRRDERTRPGAPTFDAANPASWRVQFAFKPPRDPHLCKGGCAPRIRALWGPSPLPVEQERKRTRWVKPAPLRLAMRLEALRRVIANPAPHAQRLARLLPRLCRRYPGAILRYALATARPHRSDEGDPRLIVDAMGLALAAAPAIPNSS